MTLRGREVIREDAPNGLGLREGKKNVSSKDTWGKTGLREEKG